MSNVKYLSYDGLEYFWKNKLKPIIEENEEVTATALTDLDTRLNTHTHTQYAPTSHTHTKSQITDFPTIPTVNNGTLIIQQNGTNVGTFTANQSGNTTVNISAATPGHTHNYSPSTHTHSNVAYAATAGYAASAGTAANVKINVASTSVYYPIVFTNVTATNAAASLYIDSSTGTSQSSTGMRYNPSLNACYCSGGFYELSDENSKNFGDDIEVDLDKLSTLSKKYFTWKDDKSNTRHIGISAQEVQNIYPELVNIIDDNGRLSVSYDKLSVVALKGIDILNDKVKSLEKRLNKLEEKLNIAQ